MDFIIHLFENANLFEILMFSGLFILIGFFSLVAIIMSISFCIHVLFVILGKKEKAKKHTNSGYTGRSSGASTNIYIASTSSGDCSGASGGGAGGCGGF